jgi:rod shape-determining protein MreD
MNKYILFPLVFLIGVAFQFGVSQFLSIYGLAPNLIIVAIVFIGLSFGSLRALVFGFFWGLAWDSISVDLFGSHALLYTAIGFLSGFMNKKWDESRPENQMLLTFGASLIYSAGMIFLYQLFAPGEHSFSFNHIIILQPFYNMIVAPAVFFAGNIINKFLE